MRDAASSSARTTVVPTAMIRPPWRRVDVDRVRGSRGNSYGSSSGSIASRLGIAGRRNTSRVSKRRERSAACAKAIDQTPIEQESRGWRFERDGTAGNFRPGIPHRQRIGQIRGTGSDGHGAPTLPKFPATCLGTRPRSTVDAPGSFVRRHAAGRAATHHRALNTGGTGLVSVGIRKSPAPNTTAVKRSTC